MFSLLGDQLSTCAAVVSPYMRKRNEGGPRGAFSAQMENFFLLSLSSYSPGFVTSDSGSSSPLLDPAPPPPTPPALPGQDTAVGFVFGHVFLLLGVHLCEARAQRGPLVQCRVLGSIKIEPAGQHILALSAPEPDILFHC